MRLTTLHIQNDKFDILRIIKAFSTTVCTAQKAWEAHHANIEIYYNFDFEVSWQWKTCFLKTCTSFVLLLNTIMTM